MHDDSESREANRHLISTEGEHVKDSDGVESSNAVSDTHSGTGFWRVAQSVAAAAIGVQSRKNRERDFTQGKPIHFIIGGLIGTLLFLIVIWLLVQYLLLTS